MTPPDTKVPQRQRSHQSGAGSSRLLRSARHQEADQADPGDRQRHLWRSARPLRQAQRHQRPHVDRGLSAQGNDQAPAVAVEQFVILWNGADVLEGRGRNTSSGRESCFERAAYGKKEDRRQAVANG